MAKCQCTFSHSPSHMAVSLPFYTNNESNFSPHKKYFMKTSSSPLSTMATTGHQGHGIFKTIARTFGQQEPMTNTGTAYGCICQNMPLLASPNLYCLKFMTVRCNQTCPCWPVCSIVCFTQKRHLNLETKIRMQNINLETRCATHVPHYQFELRE